MPETQDAEFVSLEDADAEAQGKKVGGRRSDRRRRGRYRDRREPSTMPPSSRSRKRPTTTSPTSSASARTRRSLETGPRWPPADGATLRADLTRRSQRRVPDGAIAQLGERLNGIQEVGVRLRLAPPSLHRPACQFEQLRRRDSQPQCSPTLARLHVPPDGLGSAAERTAAPLSPMKGRRSSTRSVPKISSAFDVRCPERPFAPERSPIAMR